MPIRLRFTNAKGHQSQTSYNIHTGVVAASTDANGQTASFQYDTYNRVTQQDAPDGGWIKYFYGDSYFQGKYRTYVTTWRKIDSLQHTVTVNFFDGIGRLIRTRTDEPGGAELFVDREFALCSCTGKTSKVSMPYRTGEPVHWTETQYDGLGRVKKVIPPDGSSSSSSLAYKYGVIASGSDQLTVSAAFDAKGVGKAYLYDVLGNLREVRENAGYSDFSSSTVTTYNQRPDSTYTTGQAYRYNAGTGQYDLTTVNYSNYNYQEIFQGAQTRTFKQDSLGRLKEETHPEAGTTAYNYDDNGNVVGRTDARGWTTSYTYDQLNRPTNKSYTGDGGVTPAVQFNYDTATNGVGRMAGWSMSNSFSGSFSYDVMGRTAQETKIIRPDQHPEQISYTYNAAGQVTSKYYPNGYLFYHWYNALGQMTMLSTNWNDANHPGTLLSNLSYSAAGAPTYGTYGDGREFRRGYNSAQQLQYQEVKDQGIAFANDSFESGSGTDASEWDELTAAARSSERALRGKYSMKLTSTGLALARTTNFKSVSPSTLYTLSAYMYIESYTGGQVYIDLNDGNGQGGNFTDVDIMADTSKVGRWQKVSGTFTTGPSTTGVRVRPVHAGSGSATIFVDEVGITAGSRREAAAFTYQYEDSEAHVMNPGFEDGTGTDAAGWNEWSSSRSSERSYDGTYSLKVVSSGVSATSSSSYARVSGSTQYQLSGYVWVSSFTGGNIYLDLNDGNGEGDSFIDAHAVVNTSLTGQWQQINATFTTSPGTTGVTIRIVHDGGGSTTFFLDQVSIRAVNPQNGANTGRIQKVNDHLDESWSQSYSYDAFGRLTQATSSAWGLQWSYDRYGNLLGQTATGGTPPRYTVSADPNSNRVISRTDLATSQTQYWTYDAAGNVTYDGRYSYVWDAENRLIQVKVGANVISQYQYDAFGARIVKIAGSITTRYYFGVAETENLYWSKIHVVAFGEKLVEYSNGTTNFYAANHLGSVAALMDKDGNVTSDMRFYPFGERIIGDSSQRHQFTGQERDGETGNDYFGARHYWSGGGRWLSVDPVHGDVSNPKRLNRYAYVLDDPVNYVDPGGTDPQELCGYNGNPPCVIVGPRVDRDRSGIFEPGGAMSSAWLNRLFNPFPQVSAKAERFGFQNQRPSRSQLQFNQKVDRELGELAAAITGTVSADCEKLFESLGIDRNDYIDKLNAASILDGSNDNRQVQSLSQDRGFQFWWSGTAQKNNLAQDVTIAGWFKAKSGLGALGFDWDIQTIFFRGRSSVNAATIGHEAFHLFGKIDTVIQDEWGITVDPKNTKNISKHFQNKCL